MSELTAEILIRQLNLTRHSEGGWYREVYRSVETIPVDALPARFGGQRPFSTSIYFLLERGDFSALHRIKSDELWHFYAGAAITIHALTPNGNHLEMKLGSNLSAGESFQLSVSAGSWFGAELTGNGQFSLVGCTVAPGFDFADFKLGDKDFLLRQYPAQEALIRRLTRMDVE